MIIRIGGFGNKILFYSFSIASDVGNCLLKVDFEKLVQFFNNNLELLCYAIVLLARILFALYLFVERTHHNNMQFVNNDK